MNPEKPKAVLHAEWALWAWTAWSFLFGIYQIWAANGGEAQELIGQFEFITGVTLGQLRMMGLGAYALAALSMVWVILRLGDGKGWARTTVLVTFVLEVLWLSMSLDTSATGLLADVPDFVLQIYALYLLYTEPGRSWFKPRPRTAHEFLRAE